GQLKDRIGVDRLAAAGAAPAEALRIERLALVHHGDGQAGHTGLGKQRLGQSVAALDGQAGPRRRDRLRRRRGRRRRGGERGGRGGEPEGQKKAGGGRAEAASPGGIRWLQDHGALLLL